MPLSAGDRLGLYEILELFGKGGMGEVYRARDPRLNRHVAIKTTAAQATHSVWPFRSLPRFRPRTPSV